ncbi:VWA domain-containing protein [soil metagenome]
MNDARASAPLRVVVELLCSLRRARFVISPAVAIDAVRAARAVGFAEKATLRAALAAVVVTRKGERRRFDATFDAFFGGGGRPRTLWERLAGAGYTEAEVGVVREWLSAYAARGDDGMATLGALLEGGAELDRLLLLGGVSRTLRTLTSPLQVGFFTHRVAAEIGATAARDRLRVLRTHLTDALGARGDELATALARELDEVDRSVRAFVDERAGRAEVEADSRRRVLSRASVALDGAELEAVRRAVRTLAARLGGAERTRKLRARRGRIDPHRTLRRILRTGGVPFAPARRRKKRDRAKLILLCDVSDSVRAIATFLLEFVYSAHDLFPGTRSFVFVSDVGETTALFEHERPERAIAAAYGGGVIAVTDNSNYGRALRSFVDRWGKTVDRRSTVVVLGDGRSNFHDPGEDALAELKRRARAVLWLCPEARAEWATGDSAMVRYEAHCTEVLEVRTVEDLEKAARRLVRR